MSEKKFEECVFQEATHVEVNGVVFQIADNIWKSDQSYVLCWLKEDITIPIEYFSTFGIKMLKEIKRELMEFEAVFAKYDGKWYPLYAVNDVLSYQNNKKARFRCVEILEDEK